MTTAGWLSATTCMTMPGMARMERTHRTMGCGRWRFTTKHLSSSRHDPYNLANGYMGLTRGGSHLFYDNVMPVIAGPAYPKTDLNLTAMNLQRNGGPHPCWGTGTSGGAQYPLPRSGRAGATQPERRATLETKLAAEAHRSIATLALHVFSGTVDSFALVGDSEPDYYWGNTRTAAARRLIPLWPFGLWRQRVHLTRYTSRLHPIGARLYFWQSPATRLTLIRTRSRPEAAQSQLPLLVPAPLRSATIHPRHR